MIIKISNYFKISVDELLKNDTKIVEKIDDEKEEKEEVFYFTDSYMCHRKCLILILYNRYQERIAVNFSMKNTRLIKVRRLKNYR